MNVAGGGGQGFDEAKLARAQVRTENAAVIDQDVETWLIGKSASDSKVIDALWMRGQTLRIAKRQGCWSYYVLTHTSVRSRVNVGVDANNIITEVLGWG